MMVPGVLNLRQKASFYILGTYIQHPRIGLFQKCPLCSNDDPPWHGTNFCAKNLTNLGSRFQEICQNILQNPAKHPAKFHDNLGSRSQEICQNPHFWAEI